MLCSVSSLVGNRLRRGIHNFGNFLGTPSTLATVGSGNSSHRSLLPALQQHVPYLAPTNVCAPLYGQVVQD